MASHDSTALARPSKQIADLERRFRENEARWNSIEDVLQPEQAQICEECSAERERILAELSDAPIASAAEAATVVRIALDTLGPLPEDPAQWPEEVSAQRCLRRVQRWLEQHAGEDAAATS